MLLNRTQLWSGAPLAAGPGPLDAVRRGFAFSVWVMNFSVLSLASVGSLVMVASILGGKRAQEHGFCSPHLEVMELDPKALFPEWCTLVACPRSPSQFSLASVTFYCVRGVCVHTCTHACMHTHRGKQTECKVVLFSPHHPSYGEVNWIPETHFSQWLEHSSSST